jgi:hypothetical protein
LVYFNIFILHRLKIFHECRNRPEAMESAKNQSMTSAPAIHPVRTVARKAVHKARPPITVMSLARDGTSAVRPPIKIPMLARCTKPHNA